MYEEDSSFDNIVKRVEFLSKISAGSYKYKKNNFVISQVFDKLLKIFNDKYPNREIKINYGDSIDSFEMVADKERLKDMLYEIINNAFVYSFQKDSVEVLVERAESFIVVNVKDFGIGIDDARIEMIYNPFGQVREKIRESREGLGLGLTIAKVITTDHGGFIRVKSSKDMGSVFRVIIPDGIKRSKVD